MKQIVVEYQKGINYNVGANDDELTPFWLSAENVNMKEMKMRFLSETQSRLIKLKLAFSHNFIFR